MRKTINPNIKQDSQKKHLQQLAVYQEVNELIASEETIENILLTIFRRILNGFDYCAAQIYQLSPSNEDLWLYLELGPGSKPVTQNRDIFSVNEQNIISDTIHKNEPIYIPDVSKGPYSYYMHSEDDTIAGSELALPLKFGQKSLGVLRVESNQQEAFDTEDSRFFSGLANQLASIISNNRKIQQLQDSIGEIQTLYHLQYQETIEQSQTVNKKSESYQYDKNTVTRADDLPDITSLTIHTPGKQSDITITQNKDNRELIAPIQLNGEIFGVLGIEGDIDTEEWTIDDINLLEEVSSQVALAIENSRLLQQTQERTTELSILFEATRKLTETIDLNQIYGILTSQTINYLNADRCSVLHINETRTHFEVSVEKVRHKTGQLMPKSGSRIEAIEDFSSLQEMLKSPTTIIHQLDDPKLESNTRKYMERRRREKVYTLTRFPLVVRSRLVAIMEVEHFEQPHDYTKNELQLAQAIISQVTVAIENAQLFQQTEMALSETQNLYEISRALVESTSIDDIFDIVLKNVKTFEIDRVSISLLDRAQSGEIESTTIAATWDRDPNKISPVGTKFSIDDFSLVQTFARPPFHPLISTDLSKAEDQDERMDEAFRIFTSDNLGAVTMFSAPMFLGAEYKGVLSIYTRKPHIYSEQEIRIYQTLADQAIITIENYRLLEATRRERDTASLLFELGQILSHTTKVDEVNEAILSFTQRINITHSEIYITDGGDFVSIASSSHQRQELSFEEQETTINAFFEAAGILALNQQEKIVKTRSDIQEGEWPVEHLTGMPPMGTFACIPFYSQRSTLRGILTFFHQEPEGFTEDHITSFDSIAIQMATTLENVWLLRQTNLVLSETELLYKATTGFNSAQTIDDLLVVLIDSLTEANIDFMSIALIPEPGSDDTSPELLDIVASWHRQTEDITLGLQLVPEQFSFMRQIRSNAAQEIYYSKLDANTQANIDRYFGKVRTILSIPLTVGRNWLGVLLLASQVDRFVFEVNTFNHIFTLAGQAAVVIQNLQLVEETQQNLFNSEILSSLGQQLLTAATAEEIYDLALSAVASTEPDRGAAILMYDQIEGSIDLEMAALWDYPGQEWPPIPAGARFSTKELGLVPLLKTGLTVISNNATEDERFSAMLRQLLALMQIRVMVAVPLWLHQEVGGFILIGNHSKNYFSTDIVRLYEDIARQTSGALENRRLFDEARYRASQLQAAAEVSQAATSYLDLDTLLTQSVNLIRDRFDYYHVSIFLVDDYRRYAVVQASTGEIGQKMLSVKHKLEVGGRSIVGTTTGTGKPRVALDVGKDAVHFNNPLLPNTRSEMALPLIAQGQVIGALDVQSNKRGAFSENDITILQSMANQLANAIEAARAFQESKDALEETNKLHQYYLRDRWGAYLKEQKTISGYRLIDDGLILEYKSNNISRPGAAKAIDEKHAIIIPDPSQSTNGSDKAEIEQGIVNGHDSDGVSSYMDDNGDVSRLIAPLTLNGQAVIGTVDFEISQKDVNTVWDEDTQKIIEAVTNQAAQAIESTRLYQQSQVSREEAEALYDVGRSLVTAESEQVMFNTVLGMMLSTLGLSQGGVLFFDDDRKFGRLYALYQDGKPVAEPNLLYPIEGNLSYEKLIETKRPVAIEDMATDPLVTKIKEMNLVGNIASLLLVPIIISDEVIGALGADSVGQKHVFAEREMNLAMAMADQLSIALQNRRLIEETRKRAVLLQTSADVGRVATSILDQEFMMDQAVELIRERFGFYHVQIFLIDNVGQYAVLHKSTGEAGLKLLESQHKLAIGSQSVIGQVTDRRVPIVARSTDNPDESTVHNRNEFLPDTQAELAVPLQVGDTLIGALDVQSTSADAFTDEEISTLEILAAQLAIAIQNARAFKEQQETAERLKEIDKLKTQFLANMSHELRTPLNSIIGFSRVILKGIDGPLTEMQKADLTSIHNSGQHLLGLINNILDLSKIEAGKMELNFAETEIEPIIKAVTSTALALVKDKDITLHQEIPDDLPKVWADTTRIRQIVLNLVSNACKFTDEGTIITQVRTENEKVIFSVTDSGIGIPEDQMASIFEEFTQVDASTTRKVGGTGLGLPISRYFVEMHHGEIWVESEVGKGSTFSFNIPIKPSSDEEPSPSLDELLMNDNLDTAKKLVVAIDDDPGVITLYQRFLEKQNYEVIGITDSENIVSQVKEYDPCAILLDVVLPTKDGWTILKDLKDDPFTKDIPVIMCSIISDKNRGFSLGAANYLTKPISENKLVDAIKQLDGQHKQEIKVVVIDDQADDILLIRRILEAQSNYNIIEANNGKEGLSLIKSKEPDLVILDLNMPEMDGFATIEALKEDEKTRAIPIIIVSGQELNQDEYQHLTGQVEALLQKGLFTENELLEDVSRALESISREEEVII